MKDILAS